MFARVRCLGGGAIMLLIAVMGVSLSGCEDEYRYRYRAHSDKITLGAGDAAASNIATHMIDPWPPSSQRAQIDQNGKRAHISVKRYETNTSISPKGIGATTGVGVNAGNDMPPSPSARN